MVFVRSRGKTRIAYLLRIVVPRYVRTSLFPMIFITYILIYTFMDGWLAMSSTFLARTYTTRRVYTRDLSRTAILRERNLNIPCPKILINGFFFFYTRARINSFRIDKQRVGNRLYLYHRRRMFRPNFCKLHLTALATRPTPPKTLNKPYTRAINKSSDEKS